MRQKFWLAVLVTFVLAYALDFLIFRVIMQGTIEADLALDYSDLVGVIKLVAALIFSVVFVWIYSKGIEAKPALGQGLRYGLAVGVLYYGAGGLHVTTIVPMGTTASWQIVLFGIVETVILGGVAAMVLGPRGAELTSP